MIWFFIAGWISGAVFMILYARWWVYKHTKFIRTEGDRDETGHPGKDGAGNQKERILAEPAGNADRPNHMGPASEQRLDNKG